MYVTKLDSIMMIAKKYANGGHKNIAAANSAAAIFLWAILAIAIDVVRR